MGWRKRMKGSGPFIGMVMVQLISTGLQILSKVILSQGTFIFALMAYRHLLAALCIAPFAFFLERGNWKKLTLMVGFWIFLSSLTGITMGMGLFYYGLRDTTATYATNFLNLIPVVTFIFSILVRMESLKLNTKRGKIRVIGTILCVAGALTISLYKGKSFDINHHHHHHHHHHTASMIINKATCNLTRGTVLLVGSCFAYATWFLVQVKLLKAFPSKYWATLLTCIGATIQTAAVGVCIDRRKSSWMLGWNLQLITILYSGVLASAVSFCLISWAVAIKGPAYPPMFNPLSLIFIALIEALLLGEDLSIGSLVGMVVIIAGLYSFLWGSRGEVKEEPQLPKSGSKRSKGRGVLEGQTEVGVELGDPHFTATIVPAASPFSLTDDERPCLVTSF